MLNIWSTEASAFAFAAIAFVLLGLLGNNWLVASLVTSAIYIAWLYRRLLRLEQWIRRGSRPGEIGKDRGFIGVIAHLLYRQQKQRNKRKRRTKKILHQLKQNISALPDATVLLDKDLSIEWCNEPASHLLNLRSPQDLGNKINNIIRDPGLQSYLESAPDGKHIEIESPVNANIVIQVKKVSLGAKRSLLIARNISDQKQLQESLKNFVANASHELRSPLTVIRGHLEMLETDETLSRSGKKSVQIAQRQAGRMQELVQNLLLLSQIESHYLSPDQGDRVAIAELHHHLLDALEKHDDSDRVLLEFPEQFYLLGIKMEIEGICINLLENAIKYSTPGTAIRAKWFENSRGEYVFAVEDHGDGIEAAEISKLTNRYYRGRKSRVEATGSGLGLAIVQQAANKHGAIFNIASEPGKGSCFSITFPSYRSLRDDRRTDEAIQPRLPG